MCRRSPCVVALVLSACFATLSFAQKPQPPRVGTGIFRGLRVTYEIENSRMIFDGDIVLDHVAQKLPENGSAGGTIDYLQYQWPKVGSVYQIPYTIDANSADVSNINTAVSQYNSTLAGVIQWVPQTTETDYVDFNLTAGNNSGEGFAYIGRIGGEQQITGAGNATVATLLHEMGHTTGLWHEQSRPDRDSYVTVMLTNMINTLASNSEQQFDDLQSLTLYDWGSIMHYNAWGFSKNGAPTLESIPPGMVLSNSVGYSAGDVDAIKRLYGAAPAAVTVTTNPPGLQVIVDGNPVTTPQTFNWPLRATHSLSVPTDAQTLGSVNYTFGRWNDDGAQSHSITVLPGNGELAFPASAPAVTVYTANFIQLVPYAMTVYPTGSGTVVPSPTPQSYPGITGAYYTARQLVTLTATPGSGQNFYEYINSPYWLPGGLGTNPKTFYVMDTGVGINTTASFSSTPVYIVTSNPTDSNFYVNVDNQYWPAPKSFSSMYDSTWTSGSTHSISVDATQWPYAYNSRYLFGSWSDGGAQTHSISAPATNTTYTATLDPQYYLNDYANEGCAGTIGVTPASPTGDGFYPSGTPLTFSETPATGWTFTEWQHDLTGTTDPKNTTMNDELWVTADYSTTATPLTVTGLSPAAAIAGSGKITLTINGTGFTAGSVVFFNNVYHASTLINGNTLTIALSSTDLAVPGGDQVFVENFPSGATCAAYQALPFNVASSPIVKPSVLSLAFAPQIVSTTSAAKTVTIKNTSKSAVTLNSETASAGDFAISSNSCGGTLGAGKTCALGLTFTPAAAGAVTGTLSISDTAPDSPQTVTLTGTGNLPLSVSPATLAFGTVAVGTTTAAKTVTLTNNESSTLSFAFAASGNYAISSTGTTCGASLASKSTCNIAVTFTPTADGATNGAVSITDNTAFSPQLLALSGTGSGGSVAPLTFTPATLSYGTQVVGTTSAAKTVTVKNTSAGAVTLSSIASTGDFAAVGSGTKPCAASLQLNAGASCTMSVTFFPAFGASGTITGAVVITDNAAVGQQILDVKGPASLPLTFSPTSLTFAAQDVATSSAPQTVTVMNNLTAAISPTIAGSGEFAAVPGGATPCGASLTSKAKCTFTVTFTPSGVGTRVSAVTVIDAANPSAESMNVTGTGQ